MSDIGRVRKIISEVIAELEVAGSADALIAKLQDASELTFRRKPVRRAPAHSPKVTPEIKEGIIELADTTDLHSSEIAARFGVNPGRVSEVLQDRGE